MFFSILIPVYNTSEYLPECMDSVLSQSFHDFEVVLLDDGATDNSGQLCDEYAQKDDRVRVIHKQNEGLMMTRRRGFKEAKGDYFICVDSDDKLYDPQVLKKIHRQIEKTGCDLVLYNYVYGAGGGRPERPREILDYPDGYIFEGEEKTILYDRLLTTNFMNNIWIKCPSRAIVDIDTDYSVWKQEICRAEDLFQSFPVLDNAIKIGYVKEPLYFYRWAPDSISNKVKFEYYNAFRCIDNREDYYVKKWKIADDIKNRLIKQRIMRITDVICKCYFKCKSNNDVFRWKEFIRVVSKDPYYIYMLNDCDTSIILPYYRILHRMIISERILSAIIVIEGVSAISRMKRKKSR